MEIPMPLSIFFDQIDRFLTGGWTESGTLNL
jgi:hypothetical protein